MPKLAKKNDNQPYPMSARVHGQNSTNRCPVDSAQTSQTRSTTHTESNVHIMQDLCPNDFFSKGHLCHRVQGGKWASCTFHCNCWRHGRFTVRTERSAGRILKLCLPTQRKCGDFWHPLPGAGFTQWNFLFIGPYRPRMSENDSLWFMVADVRHWFTLVLQSCLEWCTKTSKQRQRDPWPHQAIVTSHYSRFNQAEIHHIILYDTTERRGPLKAIWELSWQLLQTIAPLVTPNELNLFLGHVQSLYFSRSCTKGKFPENYPGFVVGLPRALCTGGGQQSKSYLHIIANQFLIRLDNELREQCLHPRCLCTWCVSLTCLPGTRHRK